MQSFQRFERSTSLFIFLLVVAFLLATFDVRGDGAGAGTTMRDGVQTLFSPLQDVASAVTRPVVGFIDALSDIASLREENDALRSENERLRAEVEQFASVQAELEVLRELNDVTVAGDLPSVVARIASAGGPRKMIPSAARRSTKTGSSATKPHPGQTASAPALFSSLISPS